MRQSESKWKLRGNFMRLRFWYVKRMDIIKRAMTIQVKDNTGI